MIEQSVTAKGYDALIFLDYVGPSGLWGGAFDSLMMPLDFPRTMPWGKIHTAFSRCNVAELRCVKLSAIRMMLSLWWALISAGCKSACI